MNILVIGGSYFYGKAFVRKAVCKGISDACDITLLNRGNVSMEEYHVRQVRGDRHHIDVVKTLDNHFDVIVDFCGYNKGDIDMLVSNIKYKPEQYIFISTVDVYKRGISGLKTEDTPYEDRLSADQSEAAVYIKGKIELERELMALSEKYGMAYTIVRPAILYGAGNYAPRENLLIRYMKEAHILPMVVGAEGEFQMVNVEDAADAICRCIGNEKAYNQCFNLCGDEVLTYDRLYDALKMTVDADYKEIHMNVQSALEQGAPTPFPLTKEETELYSNEKSKRMLSVRYMKLTEGLKVMLQ